MKALITLFVAFLITSCSVESTCYSYGQTNRTTGHGKKVQSKYARHNKARLLF